MNGRRSWFFDPRILLIGGVLLGLGLGLVIGWWWPVTYYNTDLYDLHPGYQDEYVVMVGALYALERDPQVARQLLSRLSDPQTPKTPETIVVEVTERYIARGTSQVAIGYLVGLAEGLDSVTTPMQPYLDGLRP